MRALALAFLLPAFAADEPGLVHWTNKELQEHQKNLGVKAKTDPKKISVQQLSKFGNNWTMITQRQGDGEAEVHDKVDDYFIVRGGEATLVTGGSVVDGKVTEPGEIRGPSIKGGTNRKLVVGDIVHIPARLPHQLLVPKDFTYFVIKVRH